MIDFGDITDPAFHPVPRAGPPSGAGHGLVVGPIAQDYDRYRLRRPDSLIDDLGM
jgi:hypothetical protein